MTPLEYLSPGLPGNELSPIWTSTGGCLGTRSFPNLPLDIHPDDVNEYLRAQNGLNPVLQLKHSGESVRLKCFLSQVGRPSESQTSRRIKPTEPGVSSTS